MMQRTISGRGLLLCAGLLAAAGPMGPGCSKEAGQAEVTIGVGITHPAAGQYLTTNRVRVRGTAQNVEEVEVNGVRAPVTGGQWEALVELEEGPARVEAVVKRAGAGEERAAVEFFVDSVAPVIALESPARGLVLDSGAHDREITVRGQVEEAGSGLFLVRVDQVVVEPDEDGRFELSYTLQPGLNELAVAAVDRAGNETVTRRGLIYGPLTDPTSPIPAAFGVNLTAQALETGTDVIAAQITPETVQQMLAEHMPGEIVGIEGVSFDPLTITATPRADVVRLHLLVENLRIDGVFRVGDASIATFVAIDEVAVELDIAVSATANGSLKLEVVRSELTLEEESLHSDLIEDSSFLRNLVVTVAELAFTEYVGDLIIEQLFEPDVLKRRIELLGRALEFELRFETVRASEGGLYASLSVDMPAEKYAAVPDVPGALDRALGANSSSEAQGSMKVTTNRTAIGRIAHGVWRSGLLHQSLEGANLAGMELPFPLTADGLATLLDARIRGLVDNETPAALTLRPLLPPVVEFTPDKSFSGVDLHMAEVLVDVELIHPDRPRETLLTIALFLDLGVDIEIDGGDVRLGFDVAARSEIADEPVLDFDDARVMTLIEGVLEIVPQFIANQMLVTAEGELPWFSLVNPRLDIHGLDADRLTAAIEVVAAEAQQ